MNNRDFKVGDYVINSEFARYVRPAHMLSKKLRDKKKKQLWGSKQLLVIDEITHGQTFARLQSITETRKGEGIEIHRAKLSEYTNVSDYFPKEMIDRSRNKKFGL